MKENLNATFIAEAHELLTDLEKALLQLEKDSHNKDGISEVFRTMHSLKGSASMFGFEAISELTHDLETIYESIRGGTAALTHEIFNITLKSLDHLKKLLDDAKLQDKNLKKNHETLLKEIKGIAIVPVIGHENKGTSGEEAKEESTYYVYFNPVPEILRNGTNTLYLVEDLLALGEGICLPFFNNLSTFSEIEPDVSCTGFEIVLTTDKTEQDIREVFMFVETECDLRISKINEGHVLSQKAKEHFSKAGKDYTVIGEEQIKSMIRSSAQKIKTVASEVQKTKTVSNIRVSSERLDELMNLVSELVTTQASLTLYSSASESPGLTIIAENIEKITRRLRDNAFTMSLIPLESLVVRFQRLVRDLSNELGKEVVFKAEGVETEIDKSIIEKLADPLLHLLRNSLDHGIEMPGERVKKGKPKEGTVLLKAYYSGANVIIEVHDDGAGIDIEKVKKKALDKGLISADTSLDRKEEILDLIFLPGFSTAEKVTGVSGRGVGMDVVRRNITDMRGEVEVATEKGKGTTFTIKLPLTLSIIDGLLVKVGGTEFIIPLSLVNKCYEVETAHLEETFNQWVTLDGKRTPFLYLRKEFAIGGDAPSLSQVIKVSHQGGFVGLAVDKIIGEYQAVLKPLGELYQVQDEFSGATILGDGSVALVLDPHKLIRKLVDKQQLDLRLAEKVSS